MCHDFFLYHILPPLCPKSSESLARRLLYALDHYYQVAPLHGVAVCTLVILGQFEATGLQTLHIHHHATVLGMKQLHQAAAGTNEDKHVAIAYVASHLLMHHTAERTDALTHVSPPGAQVVTHRVIQAEHGSQGFCSTIRATRPLCHCRSGHEDH